MNGFVQDVKVKLVHTKWRWSQLIWAVVCKTNKMGLIPITSSTIIFSLFPVSVSGSTRVSKTPSGGSNPSPDARIYRVGAYACRRRRAYEYVKFIHAAIRGRGEQHNGVSSVVVTYDAVNIVSRVRFPLSPH